MPQLSRNTGVTEARPVTAGRAHVGSDIRPRPPRPLPPSHVRRLADEGAARVDAPAAPQPRREPAPVAVAKPRACPPPLPQDARPSRVTPPPLPPFALPVTVASPATVARPIWDEAIVPASVASPATLPRPTRDEDIPDFLDGAARRRRVLSMVLAVAGLALLAAVIATVASHYRPM